MKLNEILIILSNKIFNLKKQCDYYNNIVEDKIQCQKYHEKFTKINNLLEKE